MKIDEKTMTFAAAMVGKPSFDQLHAAGVAQVVQEFGSMTQQQRTSLAQTLACIAGVLNQAHLFQSKIFERSIKIPVESQEQAGLVQRSLFRFGCGFFDGGYPLTQAVELGRGKDLLCGVHVSATGKLSITFQSQCLWFDQCEDLLIEPEAVLAAQTLSELAVAIERAGVAVPRRAQRGPGG